jgi:hypothetical protein
MKIGDTATVYVNGEAITGRVYNVRDNGWACVQTQSGRVASGPDNPEERARSIPEILQEQFPASRYVDGEREETNI